MEKQTRISWKHKPNTTPEVFHVHMIYIRTYNAATVGNLDAFADKVQISASQLDVSV